MFGTINTSGMKITVISGADKNYKQFYEKVRDDSRRFGYEFIGYDYGGLGDGIPFEVTLRNPKDFTKYVGKIPDKPKIILDAINRTDNLVAYLDADVRIQDKFDEVVGDYDIGVTVHDPKFHDGELVDTRYNFITCYLNAGVIFANNTENARRFISEWIKEIQESSANSDQEGLTNLLRKHVSDWSKEYHDVLGIRVRFFPASKYNFITRYGYDEISPKLIHFTGTVEEKINNGALL